MNKFLWLIAISTGASFLAWFYSSTRFHNWPPPHRIPLFAFPEFILCLVGLITALAAFKYSSEIHKKIICVFLFMVMCTTAFFTVSTRLNYSSFIKHQSADLRKMLDAQAADHQKQLQ